MQLIALVPLLLAIYLPSALAALEDFRGFGELRAQNMSFNGYGFGDGRDKGCITDEFTWTLRPSRCGRFFAFRKGLKFSNQYGNSTYVVLESRNGVCGLGKKDRVACGKWVGEAAGPLEGRDRKVGGGVEKDEVLKEGKWFAVSHYHLHIPIGVCFKKCKNG